MNYDRCSKILNTSFGCLPKRPKQTVQTHIILMLFKDNPRMGRIHFVRKLLMFCSNGLYFWLGPILQAIQISCKLCSNVDIKDSWALKNFKWPIKIWKFEWDMGGQWLIIRAHHHFGLGISLSIQKKYDHDPGLPC